MSPLLPLFPLDLVLLPRIAIPLHIFEPRYRAMIGECLAEKKAFGVVRAQGEDVAEIGCAAEITAVPKRYPDGRMDIVAEGGERFEIMQVDQGREFLRAEVVYFKDEPGSPTEEDIAHATKLHGQILALAGAHESFPPVEASELSFYMAGSLPLDLDFKQTLLSTRSEAKRIQAIITYFETILPNLQRALRTRQSAGGNGHGH